ncbi:carboxypeptidase regulatory-like domain-containing protein [Flammeovirga sp. SubArs3]|uniref:carboxypeptidase-like regulatory domain-containing protein n=1 Tax=Flammeovirga sp. SubArs3 TaxID=2995316 RepID=UPI00248AAFF1|nr:carboxypeptidase regulatory-like domain-containing protein [Flammeovirga sp. SubArs3]
MTSKFFNLKLLFYFFSFFSITSVYSQITQKDNIAPSTDKHWALTVYGGWSNYYGDLTKSRSPFTTNFQLIGGNIGGAFEKRLSHRIVVRGEFGWSRISGDDNQTAEAGSFEYDRNLHFRNDLFQLSALGQIDILPHLGHYSQRRLVTPYILTGVTVLFSNPRGKTTENNGSTWVDLQPLGTEGQGTSTTKPKYNKTVMALPLGLGVNFKVTDRLDIGVEWVTRFTATDYLDDISKSYVGDAFFGGNQLAAAMADRSQESIAVLTGEQRQVPEYKFGPGDKRGSNNVNDGYNNVSVRVRYILSKNKAPKDLSWLHKSNEHYTPISLHANKVHQFSTRENSRFAKYQDRYSIQNLAINTEGSERSPNFYYGGLIYSTDRNDRKHFNKKSRKSYYNFYFAPLHDLYRNEQTRPIAIDTVDLKGFHHHSAFQINDHQIIATMYSADLPNQEVAQHKLYMMDILGENIWKEEKELPFNNEHYSISEPTFSQDGNTMYFVSDMEDSYGGTDIYVSYKFKGQWTYPINLGETVNTPGDEVSPFLHPDGTLYFASDGHDGMGGLDIYESISKDETIIAVANLGSPINSEYDDYGLILNNVKRVGYFTSNRIGGKGGNDIYQLNVNEINVSRMLTDEHENLFLVEEMKLKGKVISKDTRAPLPRILVSLKNKETNALITKRTDSNGQFEFDISNESNYEIFPSAFGYKRMKATQISTVGMFGIGELEQTLLIESLAKKVKLYGKVTDKKTGDILKNIELVFISPDENENIYVKSDNEGNYSMEIDKDKKYFFFVEEDGFVQKNYAIPDLSKFRTVKTMKYNIRLEPKE